MKRDLRGFLTKILDQHDLCLLHAGLIEYNGISISGGGEPEWDYVQCCHGVDSVLGEVEEAYCRAAAAGRSCEQDSALDY
jgi:hypothetical protein